MGFGAVLIVLIIFGLYLLGSLAVTRNSLASLDQQFEVLSRLSQLEADSQVLQAAARAFILTSEPRWEETYNETSLQVDNQLSDINEVLLDEQSLAALEEYRAIIDKLQGVELLIVARTKDGNVARARELFEVNYEVQQTQATLVLKRAVERERELVARTISRNSQLLQSVQAVFAVSVVIVVILILIVSWLITRQISGSIDILVKAGQAIAGGRLEERVPVTSKDEIGHLSRSFNSMASKLQKMVEDSKQQSKQLLIQNLDLEKTKERLEVAVGHLKQLDKVKSEFVSIAAHQLRTPLTGIKWTLNALAGGDMGKMDVKQDKVVRDSLAATNRLVKLVNDLLNVARLEEGRLGLTLRSQDLLKVLKGAEARFGRQAKAKGLKFSLNVPSAGLPAVRFDEEKIDMVLDNLLDNAIKYTPPGGQVDLDAVQVDERVVVTVRDTGIGIPKEQFDRVFTKFFRSENAQRSETSGTGLGLYMAHQVVDQHGGMLVFESTEGKGSTFSFALSVG